MLKFFKSKANPVPLHTAGLLFTKKGQGRSPTLVRLRYGDCRRRECILVFLRPCHVDVPDLAVVTPVFVGEVKGKSGPQYIVIVEYL